MVLRTIDGVVWRTIQTVYRLRWLMSDDRGQAMVEYAIVAALIAVAAMAAVQALGGGITTAFHNIANAVSGSGSGGGGSP